MRAAQHVAGGREPHSYTADRYVLAIVERLQQAPGHFTIAQLHDRDGARCREHPLIARPGVIAMSMSDHRPRDRLHGIDVEVAGLAIEPCRGCFDPGLGARGKEGH